MNLFNEIRTKIRKSVFARNILMITGGAAIAQIINMVLSPVLTRIYTPEEYGLISVFTAILGSLSFVGAFNYDMGIPISEDDEEAINVFILSIIILISSISILSVFLLFLNEEILKLFNASKLMDYSYLIPLGLLLIGLYNICTQWAYRKKNFKAITKTKFSQSILQNLISIGLGLFSFGSLGLLLGRIFGQSAGIMTLVFPIWKDERFLLKKVKLKALFKSLKRYKDFPLFTTPRRYLGDITVSLPIIFITSLYGNEVVGLFGLANSVIQLPMNIIGSSVSNVYYAECAELRYSNPSNINSLSKKLLKTLVLIGLVPLIILVLFGPQMFSFVFGSQWEEAGQYARLLSLVIFFRFVFKPISNIFDIFEKQRLAFYLNIFRLLLVLMVFGVSKYFYFNAYVSVFIYSITMSLVYFFQYLLAQKIINNYNT